VVNNRCREQGNTEAVRMRKFSGQAKPLVNSLESLVGIAERPEGICCVAMADYSGVVSIEESQGAMLLGIVERDSLLQGRLGRGKLTQKVQGWSSCSTGFQKKCRVLGTLGELQKLTRQFPSDLKLSPHSVEIPQSQEYREELGGFS
jgi:hypothetical protein